MFSRYEKELRKIPSGKREKIQVSALEHWACRREVILYRTIARWVETFHQGREECQHIAHAGRPIAPTDDHVEALRVLLEEDRCWTYGDFQGTWYSSINCPYHLRKKLNMPKVCAHWDLHTLTEIGKWQWMETARMHLERYEHKGEAFHHCIITIVILEEQRNLYKAFDFKRALDWSVREISRNGACYRWSAPSFKDLATYCWPGKRL